MDTGVAMFPTHDAIAPASWRALVEERGHESLLFPEHTHIPASRESPFPGGGELPRKYAHTYDLFVAHDRRGGRDAAAAGRQRHLPDHRARPDHHREGGREHRPPLRRARSSSASARAGTARRWPTTAPTRDAAWPHARARRGDEGDLDGGRGQLRTASTSTSSGSGRWPKPVQRPHPPVLIGGNGAKVLDRVLAFGDAWFPNHAHGGILERLAELRAARGPAGRADGHGRSGRRAGRSKPMPAPGSGGRSTGCRRRRAGRSSGRSTGTRRRSRSSTGPRRRRLTAAA